MQCAYTASIRDSNIAATYQGISANTHCAAVQYVHAVAGGSTQQQSMALISAKHSCSGQAQLQIVTEGASVSAKSAAHAKSQPVNGKSVAYTAMAIQHGVSVTIFEV